MSHPLVSVRYNDPKLYRQLGYLSIRGTGKGYKSRVTVFYKIIGDRLAIEIRRDKIKGNHLSELELYLNESFEDNSDIPELIENLMNGEIVFVDKLYL